MSGAVAPCVYLNKDIESSDTGRSVEGKESVRPELSRGVAILRFAVHALSMRSILLINTPTAHAGGRGDEVGL